MAKKSAGEQFREAYQKNPAIVRKFIRWKIAIFLVLLVLVYLLNRYLSPGFR